MFVFFIIFALSQEIYGENILPKRVIHTSCCINFKELAEGANISEIFPGIVPVVKGGTGVSTLTAYAVLSAGATSTAAVTMISSNATSLILASNFGSYASFKTLSIRKQIYTIPGTYTYVPSVGLWFLKVEAIGGGGGGGGCAATANFLASGGGSAGYAVSYWTAKEITESNIKSIIVGSGGAGGVGGAAGQAGEASSFISLNPIGSPGLPGRAGSTSAVLGGNAGGASGNLPFIGYRGGSTTGYNAAGALSGAGANSVLGQGGYAVVQQSSGKSDGQMLKVMVQEDQELALEHQILHLQEEEMDLLDV